MAKKTFKKIAIILLMVGIFGGCGSVDDVTFAHSFMDQLIRGRYSARTMIDWTRFKMMERDVAKECARLKSQEGKDAYARAFIEGFSRGFNQNGGQSSWFFNWRMLKDDNPKVKVVTANYRSEKLAFLFYIAHDGQNNKKIIEIRGGKVLSQEQARALQENQNKTGEGKNETTQE